MFVLLQIQKKQSMITYNLNERKNMKNTEGNGVAKGASSPPTRHETQYQNKKCSIFLHFCLEIKTESL